MTGNDIRTTYLDHMRSQGHAIVPSSPIVPENDPTTLFTGSGMQPMISYLLGEVHPLGDRLADSQKCFRSEDIEEVGNNRHTTFFEMLGNWSLGSYWKKEQLTWIYDYMINVVGLDPNRLYATYFSGSEADSIPADSEAVDILQAIFSGHGIDATVVILETEAQAAKSGMQGGRIFGYGAKKNWWSRAGVPENMPAGEPGGPDSEIFYEFSHIEHDPAYGDHCHPNCDCGRFMEIGNSVFMAYIKQDDGSFVDLPKKNIDFGGGLERIAAAANDDPDVFKTDLFWPLITHIESLAQASYTEQLASFRLIADHMRGAVMMISEGVLPANKQQGYFVRRLLRRCVLEAERLGLPEQTLHTFTPIVANLFQQAYPELAEQSNTVSRIIEAEEAKFRKAMRSGKRQLEKDLADADLSDISLTSVAQMAFDYFQTYGVPLEVTYTELAQLSDAVSKLDLNSVEAAFQSLKREHATASRSAASGMFKGGLADHSEAIVKYHTATHLLQQALRDVLGDHVHQMGSNITGERLRFDFAHDMALTEDQKREVLAIVNEKILDDLPVTKSIEAKEEALASGALAFFKEAYPDRVSVYTIGDPNGSWYSKELCGGPHVSSTGEIGAVTIKKEQSVGAGVRRLYLVRTT